MVRRLQASGERGGYAGRLALEDEIAADLRRAHPSCPPEVARSCAATVVKRAVLIAAIASEAAAMGHVLH